MNQDNKAAFAGLQISIVGTALLAIASHPSEGGSLLVAPGVLLLLAGIWVTAKTLYRSDG
jgi:phosphate starvation-inducible membrane PsiE